MPPQAINAPVHEFHALFLQTKEWESLKHVIPELLKRIGSGEPNPIPVAEYTASSHREAIEAAVATLTEVSKRGALGPILVVPGAIIFGELQGFVGIAIDNVIVPAGGVLAPAGMRRG